MVYGLRKGSRLTEAFVKTIDKNIVDWYEVQKSEIYLDKLQQQIDDIQEMIDLAPIPVEYPPGVTPDVQRAIDYYNEDISDIAELERRKTQLEELKARAKAAESILAG